MCFQTSPLGDLISEFPRDVLLKTDTLGSSFFCPVLLRFKSRAFNLPDLPLGYQEDDTRRFDISACLTPIFHMFPLHVSFRSVSVHSPKELPGLGLPQGGRMAAAPETPGPTADLFLSRRLSVSIEFPEEVFCATSTHLPEANRSDLHLKESLLPTGPLGK